MTHREIRKQLKEKPTEVSAPFVGIDSGITLLNLAATDTTKYAFDLGTMVNVIGGSFAGKSALSKQIQAMIACNPDMAKYHLIEDNTEYAYKMNKMFGETYQARVKAPTVLPDGRPMCSYTVEDFQDNILRYAEAGEPFAYFLDSIDALTSEDELVLAKKQAAARKKAKKRKADDDDAAEVKGPKSYGTERAKALSRILRMSERHIYMNNSFGLVVSQVRMKLDAGPFEDKEQRSGGLALKHYMSHEIWLKNAGVIKEGDVKIGHKVKITLKKNRTTGKERSIMTTLLTGYGFDNIKTNIDYLLATGFWTAKSGVIHTDDFLGTIPIKDIVDKVESDDLEAPLIKLVGKVWRQNERVLVPSRKMRFS